VISGDPGLPSSTFDRKAIGGDLKLRWWLPKVGWSEAIAEVVVATNLDRGLFVADPVAEARDLRELGWHVGIVQGLTDRAMIGARLDQYRPDRDAFESRGATRVGTDPTWTTLSVLGGWKRDDYRVVLEYSHERNPTGRADDGSITTREADRVVIRAQAGF
jgi:hypothetical protein